MCIIKPFPGHTCNSSNDVCTCQSICLCSATCIHVYVVQLLHSELADHEWCSRLVHVRICVMDVYIYYVYLHTHTYGCVCVWHTYGCMCVCMYKKHRPYMYISSSQQCLTSMFWERYLLLPSHKQTKAAHARMHWHKQCVLLQHSTSPTHYCCVIPMHMLIYMLCQAWFSCS